MTQFKSDHPPLTEEHFNNWAKWQADNNKVQYFRESTYKSVLRYQSEFAPPMPALDQAIQIIKQAGGKVLMPTTEYKEV